MNTLKELIDAIPDLKIGEKTALNFSAYITAQLDDSAFEDKITAKEGFYLGYMMGNLPVLISCRQNISDEMFKTNEDVKYFEDTMTRHKLWDEFEECLNFMKTYEGE